MTSPLSPVNKLGDSAVLLAAREGRLDRLRELCQRLCLKTDSSGEVEEPSKPRGPKTQGSSASNKAEKSSQIQEISADQPPLSQDSLQTAPSPSQTDLLSPAQLLHLRGVLSEHCNRLGKTALHEAAQGSREDVVRWLLQDVGLHPESLKQGDWTPLMLAATKDCAGVVELLLEAGADVWALNKDGWTAFHVAAREGHLETLRLLLSHSSPSIASSSSRNGRRPLHSAAMAGRAGAVEWLVAECLVDVAARDSCGTTALMEALRAGEIATARHLRSTVSLEDSLGRRAVHLSAEAGQSVSLRFLVEECGEKAGAPAGEASARQRPVHFAAREGQIGALETLCSLGAELGALDDRGRHVAHAAAAAQKDPLLRWLHDRRPELFAVEDSEGRLPSQFAVKAPVIEFFRDIHCSDE